jgi:hypothetical protein
MDSLISKLGEVISRMNAVKEAAISALAAANAASAAGASSSTSSSSSASSSSEVPAGIPYRDGGYTSPQGEAFAAAPKLSEGIANTSALTSTMGDGGIPSILHPNEAVVPLPKGRSIPVEFKYPKELAPANSAKDSINSPLNMTQAINNMTESAANSSQAIVIASETVATSADRMTDATISTAQATAASAPAYTTGPRITAQADAGYSPDKTGSAATGFTTGPRITSQAAVGFNSTNKPDIKGFGNGPQLTFQPDVGYNPFGATKDVMAEKIASLIATIPQLPSIEPSPSTGETASSRLPSLSEIDATTLANRNTSENFAVNTNPTSVNYNRNQTSNTSNNSKNTTLVTMVVNASDSDSFKRSEDQIIKRYQEKLTRVNRQNGVR